MNIIFRLFFNFLQIGSFSIGGGYAIIPLIQQQVVNHIGWLTLQEYTDIITISQMTPGPLVVNTATFVGIRIAGVLGALAATIGSILTGFIISIFFYNFFQKHQEIEGIANVLKGLRATSVGLIASAAGTIILIAFSNTSASETVTRNLDVPAIIVFIVSLFLLRGWKPSPVLLIIASGLLGLVLY